MSDDWQVVEEALNLRMFIAGRPEGDVKMAEAQIALARLRERVAELEEALREIAVDSQIPHAAPAHLGWLARRALAHEEETPAKDHSKPPRVYESDVSYRSWREQRRARKAHEAIPGTGQEGCG